MVTILLPNYKTPELTKLCIRSLRKYTDLSQIRVIAIDSASQDESAEYLRKSGAETVSLVCMGLEALAPTEEDTLCAEYIKALLENTDIDMKSGIDSLRYTSGAKFFDKAQADVFPEEDFYMCTDLDRFNFVMKLETSVDGIGYMRKVDM